MSEQPVIVNKLSWRDLCPWTIIFKCLPVAISVPVIAWALVGLVLTPMGWIVAESVCLNDQIRSENTAIAELAERNRSPYRSVFHATHEGTGYLNIFGAKLSGPRVVFEQTIKPFQELFKSRGSLWEFLYLILGCLWSLAVWSFAGLAICRTALLRLTRDEVLSLDDSFDFAVEKFKDGIGAVGLPLLAVAGLCIPAGLIGLLMGFDFGVMLAGLAWFILLAIGLLICLLLIGLMFGWPLMIASVSAEGQNSFDAMTRAYAYVFQRPLHYIGYCIVAMLFGGLCWLVVSNVTDRVVETSYWAASWGANAFDGDRIDVIRDEQLLLPAEEEISVPDVTFEKDAERATGSSETGQRETGNGLPDAGIFGSRLSAAVAANIGPASAVQTPRTRQDGNEGGAQIATPQDEPRQADPRVVPQTDPQLAEPQADREQTPQTPGVRPAIGASSQQEGGGLGGEIQLPRPKEPEDVNFDLDNEDPDKVSSTLYAGQKMIGFWNGIARTLAAAFIYGLFWCMASAIYLLLRKDVDETEMDEIYMVDERRTYDLPPLKSDEHGIPTVQTPVPVDDPTRTGSETDTNNERNDGE